MAVAFDAATDLGNSGSPGNSATLVTGTHTTSGANRLIIVGIFANTATDVVTSVTCTKGGADTAMTREKTVSSASVGRIYIYSLANPDSGSVTVKVNASSSLGSAGVVSFTGAGSTSGAVGTVDSKTQDVTSKVGSQVVDMFACFLPGGLTSGQTARVGPVTDSDSGVGRADSTANGASTVTMSYTTSGANQLIAALSVDAPATGASHLRGLMGVGI